MTRIVVNSPDLRIASGKLKHAAAEYRRLTRVLRGLGLPQMPAPVATAVGYSIQNATSTLEREAAPLEESSRELVVRAIWAEIADQLMAGGHPSAAQLAEILPFLRSGELVRYATPEQAKLAGELVGELYRPTYRDPNKLIQLADILRANGSNQDFAVGFVDKFGAENLVDVPRVIQAMEYARPVALGGIGMAWTMVDTDLARDIYQSGFVLHRNPLDVLSPFAMALAVATSSGRLTRTTEQAIAHDEDTWAVAQLLTDTQHRYGTNFLLDTFRSGVVDRLVAESRDLTPNEAYPLGYYGEGVAAGPGLPLDPKVLILQALSRNPEAAAYAFTGDLGTVTVYDAVHGSHDVHNSVELLYRFGHFDDHGAALGSAMESAVTGLHQSVLTDEPYRFDPNIELRMANDLTERWINEVSNPAPSYYGGDVSAATEHLGSTIASFYVGDLHDSAASPEGSATYDADRDGIPGSSNEVGIKLSGPQLLTLLEKLSEDDGARQHLLAGVVHYQTELVSTSTGANGAASFDWATKIGNFDGMLENANDINRIHDSEEAQARREQIVGALGKAVGFVVPESKVGGLVLDTILDQLKNGGPSVADAKVANFSFGQEMRASMEATVVSGYYENHHLGTPAQVEQQIRSLEAPGVTPVSFLEHDHIVPYNEMSQQQKDTFNAWKHEFALNDDRVESAVTQAEVGMSSRDFDT